MPRECTVCDSIVATVKACGDDSLRQSIKAVWETHKEQFYKLHEAVRAVVEISDPEYPFAFTPEQMFDLLRGAKRV
jgi:hypothetical protein